MDYHEFKRHLGKAGLNINQFAALLDVSPNSISNYNRRIVPQHYALLAVLLGDAADNKVDFRALFARFGIVTGAAGKVTQLEDYRAGLATSRK